MKRYFISLLFLVSVFFANSASADLIEKIPIGGNNFLGKFDIQGNIIWQVILGGAIKARASELTLKEQIEQYIKTMADFYGADRKEMLETSNCESGWVKYPEEAITILGDQKKSYGLWQFHKDFSRGIDTFAKFAKLGGFENVSRTSWHDATKVAAWAFAEGEKFKDDWTCYNLIFRDKTRPESANW